MRIIDSVNKKITYITKMQLFDIRNEIKISMGLRDGWLSKEIIMSMALMAQCELSNIHPEWFGANFELIRSKSKIEEDAKMLFLKRRIRFLLDQQRLHANKNHNSAKVLNFKDIKKHK